MSFGVAMRIKVGGDDLFDALPDLLPLATHVNAEAVFEAETFSLLPPDEQHGYRCLVGTELALESAQAGPVLKQFSGELMKHVANYCPDRVFVHAGVVGWKGRALVLPGTSFAGKTTLTAALVRAGATYYSDEFAAVDEEGWVHPYARDLQIREPGKTEQRNTTVASLQGHAGTVPLRVAQVVFARYEHGAQWNPRPLTPGMAVLEMIQHTIPVQRVPRLVMSTLTAMLDGATAWSSCRDEADVVAQFLLRSLESGDSSSVAPGARTLRTAEALA
jgi:hypothetical protein